MLCKHCSRELDPDWVTCPWCGIRIDAPMRKTRANGTGTAYRRGKTWTARITLGFETLPDGTLRQLRRTKSGFATKTEALRYCETLKTVAPAAPQHEPTLSDYYKAYSDGQMSALSQSKKTAYRIAYEKLSALHSVPMASLTIHRLQTVVNEACPTYYPARDAKVLLNHLFRLAAVDGKANASLPDLIQLPKLEETAREPFTAEEQAKLWHAYESGVQDAAIPLIMIYTGLMTGEMRRLTKSMIDLDHKEIIGVGLKTETRKKATVLLPDSILPVLESEMERTEADKLYPVSEDTFYARFYTALEQAGTRKLTPYSCRHTTATVLAITEGIAPQTVKRLMRWSSTRMMDRYVHPDDASARQAIDSIGYTVGYNQPETQAK